MSPVITNHTKAVERHFIHTRNVTGFAARFNRIKMTLIADEDGPKKRLQIISQKN